MPDRARRRYTTFLVALKTRSGAGAPGPVVYAAMKRDAAEALAAVQALADGAAVDVAIVGSLSTRLAKAIRLKPDELRVV
jgi:hypothetical protein